MIENILNKYVIEAPSMGRSVILADRIDEVADDIRQFLLQQTPCTTLREELEQMLSKVNLSEFEPNSVEYHWMASAKSTYERVLKLIDERQPVA